MTSSTAVTCTVPVSIFTASPYSLAWGSSIYVKVIATNLYGDSTESSEGNGAVITTSPDAPTSLVENTSQRTKSALGLTWSAGSSNGGATIIDYRISMAESGGSFSVLATGLTSAEYLATGLTSGTNYEFKVESRNSYGYSAFSSTTTLLCAYVPEAPTVVSTSNSGSSVVFSWNSPVDNGSTVSAYKIYIR